MMIPYRYLGEPIVIVGYLDAAKEYYDGRSVITWVDIPVPVKDVDLTGCVDYSHKGYSDDELAEILLREAESEQVIEDDDDLEME